MKRFRPILCGGLFAAALMTTASALPASESECTAAWAAADVGNKDTIMETDAPQYFAAMRQANKTVTADRLSKQSFHEACMAGVFANADANAHQDASAKSAAMTNPNSTIARNGALLSGANSFTERQAQDLIVKAGFSDVSGLKKDDEGIWRGKAIMAGKHVEVGVDYKGNVIGN